MSFWERCIIIIARNQGPRLQRGFFSTGWRLRLTKVLKGPRGWRGARGNDRGGGAARATRVLSSSPPTVKVRRVVCSTGSQRHTHTQKGNHPMPQADNQAGHRARLRRRFLADPTSLSESQMIELLLTFAIPRRDVAPLAQALLERFEGLEPLFDEAPEPPEPAIRTFANDEIANALAFVPQAAQFETYEAFQAHLEGRLPYNSLSTRKRRANYILNRFFPTERLDVPLTYCAAGCYHIGG